MSTQPLSHDLGTDLGRRRAPGDVEDPVERNHLAALLRLQVEVHAVQLFVQLRFFLPALFVQELRHVFVGAGK